MAMGSAGAIELEAPPGASDRPLPLGPREAPGGLIVVFGGRPQYSCEDPCLIFKRK